VSAVYVGKGEALDSLRRVLGKDAAVLDDWCRDIAPSTELRKWYGHDPARFAEFAEV